MSELETEKSWRPHTKKSCAFLKKDAEPFIFRHKSQRCRKQEVSNRLNLWALHDPLRVVFSRINEAYVELSNETRINGDEVMLRMYRRLQGGAAVALHLVKDV